MTELFAVLCADASDPRPGWPGEAKTRSGRRRRRARRAGRALLRLGASGARVLHSPRLRALESADILLRRLGGEGVACRGLDQPPSAELLAQMAGEKVVVVGHEPWLGRLVAGLVLGAPRETRFRLEEAGVAWLEGEARLGGMKVKALLPRRAVRSLGRKGKGEREP
jgi:phosphohistidine phosphatase